VSEVQELLAREINVLSRRLDALERRNGAIELALEEKGGEVEMLWSVMLNQLAEILAAAHAANTPPDDDGGERLPVTSNDNPSEGVGGLGEFDFLETAIA
jgi:hypothetical protein